jgi:CheY-like chemotaxis protein
MFRIVIAADDLPLRVRLSALVSSEPGLTVVGHAGGPSAMLGMVRQTSADVVLVDLSVAPSGTLDLIAEMRRALPGVLIVAALGTASRETVRAAFEAGASALLRPAVSSRGHGSGSWTFELPQEGVLAAPPAAGQADEDSQVLEGSVVGSRSTAGLPSPWQRPRAGEAPAGRPRPGCRGADRDRRVRLLARRARCRHGSV